VRTETYKGYPDSYEIPVCESAQEAEDLLGELVSTHEWVSVFWDRGWGDSGQPVEISIIVGGNGQNPKALLDKEIYRELLDNGVIRPNSLQTFKARKLHDYCNEEDQP